MAGARTGTRTPASRRSTSWRARGACNCAANAAVDAAPGDVARIPAGAEHWHGAHPDEPQAMTHLAITFGAPTWLEPVSDEEYRG